MMLREPPLVEIRDGDVVRARVRDQLAQEDDFGADVVREGGDVGGLERERDGGNRAVAGRRKDAIERPIVGVGGRAAVAKQDQFAAERERAAHGVDSGLHGREL